jgi:hypothetical protein
MISSGQTGTSKASVPSTPTPAGCVAIEPSMPSRCSADVERVWAMNDNTWTLP